MSDRIVTGLGEFSKAKFNSLLDVRGTALAAIRQTLEQLNYTEVSTASLVNIAGSCENPYASFTLNYYGREAHLSQSAQIQLEALVLRLNRPVFTVNNSFREENFDDPDMAGRRLSEFTLIEPEAPMAGLDPEAALASIIGTQEKVLKAATAAVLARCGASIDRLGGDADYLARTIKTPFQCITYDRALDILNAEGGSYGFGTDLGIREERAILRYFDNHPVFVTHFPVSIKFFNMKRMDDGERVYSVDLLMPRLGETTGGAVREEDGAKIKRYLLDSKIAQAARKSGGDVLASFEEYLKIFDEEPAMLRGGFGIGFERFVGFLLGSNDILETIAYRTLRPI
jgi:asparaginyl-tRNA synthetase